MKLENTGYGDSKRIINDNGDVVAMCSQYTSNLWAVHDQYTDRPLCRPVHKTPTKAMRWYEAFLKGNQHGKYGRGMRDCCDSLVKEGVPHIAGCPNYTERPKRLMPEKINLGQTYQGAMVSAMRFRKNVDRIENPHGLRTVMGMLLPKWQRPFVWTREQCVRLMESVWTGIPIGTYTINMLAGSEFDGYLIDGQQRMRAIEMYLDDEFPVFGYKWSEITEIDVRVFEMSCMFPYFETRSNDEAYLRSYYDLMNFGGTAHTDDQRATNGDAK